MRTRVIGRTCRSAWATDGMITRAGSVRAGRTVHNAGDLRSRQRLPQPHARRRRGVPGPGWRLLRPADGGVPGAADSRTLQLIARRKEPRGAWAAKIRTPRLTLVFALTWSSTCSHLEFDLTQMMSHLHP